MNGILDIAPRFTLAITVGSTLLLLLIDHVLSHLQTVFWVLAVAMIFLWSIPALYLLAPPCFILLIVPRTRQTAGVWPLLGNIAAPVMLAVALENSEIFEAMTHA